MKTIVFFGTSSFVVPCLEQLAADPEFRVVLVVTQPDKPAGRSHELAKSPVKQAAERLGIDVFQPESLRNDPSVIERLRAAAADGFVVSSYAKILPPAVLEIPKSGTVNVHPSLLPRWRGATPVPAAIVAGDTVTGVTIMLLDEGMDTGPTLARIETPIAADETSGMLLDRLWAMGAELLVPTLKDYLNGKIAPVAQIGTGITVSKLLSKDDGRIDWSKDAASIERLVRAMTPWPGAWTTFNGVRLMIRKASIAFDDSNDGAAGSLFKTPAGLTAHCGSGALVLERLQLEGKAETDSKSFLNGYQDAIGKQLQ